MSNIIDEINLQKDNIVAGNTLKEYSRITDFFQTIYRSVKQYIILKFRAKKNNFFVSAARKPHRTLKNKRYTNELLTQTSRTLKNYLAAFNVLYKRALSFFYKMQKTLTYNYFNMKSFIKIRPTSQLNIKYVDMNQ